MSGLLEMLRRNEAQTFLRNAEFVRSLPDSPEKLDAARRQIHWAMYRAALGQITAEERRAILAILRPCCPDMFSFEPAQDDPHAARAFLDDAEHCSAHAATDIA